MKSKTDAHALISLSHCSVKLDDHLALSDVTFKLHTGERWVLLGSNGAGKSVLLKLLRGDMWPTPTGNEQRKYCFNNAHSSSPVGIKHRIALLAPETQDRYVRHNWDHTVVQVVTTGLFDEDIPLTKPNVTQQRRVEQMLRRCKLWSLRQRRFLSLSYGQRRRVLLARTLISQPDVLLLDEVFNGLDTIQHSFLMRVLNDKKTRTWITAIHSSADIPDNATHVLRMHHGKLVEAGVLTAALRKQLQEEKSQKDVVETSRKKVAIINNAKPLITLRNIELYRDYRPVLKKFDWIIQRHEHWVIMGANGSGKSTLLMMLYGDLHPALGGEVIRNGHKKGTPISKWKKRVGWVSPELQADHFHAGTLEQIVASGRYSSVGLNDAITASDRRIAREGLALVGLDGYQQRGVREVSYGQMRLALLARAMINKPELLLLDEPFTGLDIHWRAAMQRAIEVAIASGMQVIMAVHQKTDLIPSINRMLKIEKGGKVVISEL